jgi:uncharacterized protein (DUF433 family)
MLTPIDLSHLPLFRLSLPPELTVWPHSKIVLTGRRIGLAIIVEDLKAGHTPEQIRDDYDLDARQLEQVIAFIREHPAEVEEYYREYQAAGERAVEEFKKSPWYKPGPTREELIRRWKEKFGDQLPGYLQEYASGVANSEPGKGTH